MEAEKPSQLSQINRILRFLGLGDAGLMFATCIYPGLIREMTEIIRERTREKGITVGHLHLKIESELTLSGQIEQFAKTRKDAEAVMVFGLAGYLDHHGADHLMSLNFARESLIALEKPLLFWVTKQKLTLIMNQAADLYSQRTYSTVFFEGVPERVNEINPLFPDLNEVAKVDKRSLELRVNLLESQREEALKRGYNRDRIFKDYDIALVQSYVILGLYSKGFKVLKDFSTSFEDSNTETAVISKRLLGDLFRQSKDFDKASDAYFESLEIATNTMEIAPDKIIPEIAGINNNLGILFSEKREFLKSKEFYQESLNLWKRLATIRPDQYLPQVARVSNNLGAMLHESGKSQEALPFLEEAIESTRVLSEKHPSIHLPYLATFLSNIGGVFRILSQPQAARLCLEESLEIERHLAEEKPDEHLSLLASTLNNLGNLMRSEQELDLARNYLDESLSIRRKLSLKNPSGIRPDLAKTLHNLGLLYSDNGKFDNGESYYLEALDIYNSLPNKDFIMDTIRLNNNLSNLYRRQEKPQNAFHYLKSARIAAEELKKQNPEMFLLELAMVNLNLAGLMIKPLNKFRKAKTHLEACLDECGPYLEDSPQAKHYHEIATRILSEIQEAIEENKDSQIDH